MKKNLDTVVLFLIDQTSKVAKQYSQTVFDKANLGITVEQWVLLKIIDEHDDLSQTELAEKSFRDPASITRTLDILEKKELVLREAILENRRQYSIKLTKSGKKFVKKNMEMIESLRTQSVKDFSDKELKTLKTLLLRIQENMK